MNLLAHTRNKTEIQPLNDTTTAMSNVTLTTSDILQQNTTDTNTFSTFLKGAITGKFNMQEMQRVSLQQTTGMDSKALFEKGTPKEYLKTVAFSIQLSGKNWIFDEYRFDAREELLHTRGVLRIRTRCGWNTRPAEKKVLLRGIIHTTSMDKRWGHGL